MQYSDTGRQTPPLAPDTLGAACADLGFSLSDAAAQGLTAYLTLLVKWNRVMNLVGPTDWPVILRTLVADSLHLADFIETLPLPEHPVCQDLGAGAGLPGLPLRLLWQRGSYTLVEAREKRALFLRTCLAARPLPGVSVFHGRAEHFLAGRTDIDLTVSRAFMPWEKVLDLVAPHTVPHGFCLQLTLAPAPDNLPAGWTLACQRSYAVGREQRWFRALQKTAPV